MTSNTKLKYKRPDIWSDLQDNALIIDGVHFVCLEGNGTEAHTAMCRINELLAHREWLITRLQFDIIRLRDTLKCLENDVLE